MVVRCADVGGGDSWLHPLPGHVRLRGHEEGQGGAQAGETGAL